MLNALLRRLRRRATDERGAGMVMAVVSIVAGSLALVAMGDAVRGGLQAARTDQNRINAFQHANAGIDLALYRIDRDDFSGGNYAATADGFTDWVTVGGSRFDVVAVRTVGGHGHTWTVRSTGTDASGKQRLTIATISAERLFHNAFFVLSDFELSGNQGTPVAYSSSACPTAAVSCGLPDNPGRLATNGTITGSGVGHFADLWDGFDMYGHASQASAEEACGDGDCGTAPKVAAFANRLTFEVPDQPAVVLPCPGGGVVNGGTLEPGDYVCDSLSLEGTITIGNGGNGSGKVRIWVEGELSSSAVVNRFGIPSRFQVFQPTAADGGPNGDGGICDSEIWGLLYTPGLEIDCSGSHQVEIYGAVVAYVHEGSGNHFEFHYDVDAAHVTREDKFTVTNWRECPVGTTDC